MKIVFAITRISHSGGASKMIAWVAEQMALKGHEVHLITFFTQEGTPKLLENVHFHPLNIPQSNRRLVRNTVEMVKVLHRLQKEVRKIRPDVFVTFLDSVGCIYLPICRLLNTCKIVASERVDPYSYRGEKAKVRFFLMKYAHTMVFQTEGARGFFKNKKAIYNNGVVIPNPVVVSDSVKALQKQVPAYRDRDNRIVTVGRLSLPQKRQDVLIEAFRIFHETHPQYRLVIYGDGQDKDKIESFVEASGLREHIVLAGYTQHAEQDIYNASAFVLSSDYEGIPNALIEAMSVGVPCVSTDCSPGGAALLLEDGENGFLVPKGDARAIADRVAQIVENESVANRFSQNAPAITKKFSESVVADWWETCFLNLGKK